MNTQKITKEFINQLNYPDFVSFINQWNVLPGSFVTINKWAVFSRINENSNILQVACTTGFQSREIALLTGCKGKAFDLSHMAVEMAEYNKKTYAPEVDIEYFQADGMLYKTDEKFSHVLIGAGIQFFPDPQKALDKSVSFLKDNGYLLASPYYAIDEVPKEIIAKGKEVFGINVTSKSYKEIMGMYESLEVMHEDRNTIPVETESELKKYCENTIDRACKIHNISDQEIYEAMYKRLLLVRQTSNLLRQYLKYSVLVLRYRKKTYPNRYVELF